MRVLLGCESSGMSREAFRRRGHDAWSCDLLPAQDGSPYHYQQDVLEVMLLGWDLAIFHPDCTYLTCSAEWCYKDNPGKKMKPGTLFGAARRKARDEAVEFVRKLLLAPIERIAVENPVGVLSSRIRKADQYIQPNEFGADASKNTGLWLKNLPTLEKDPANYVEPRWVNGLPRWANQTDSGQNRLGPSDNRWQLRADTYPGIADAFAEQWGVETLPLQAGLLN